MRIWCFTIFRIHKYSIHFIWYLYWIHGVLCLLLEIPFAQCKNILLDISFINFFDVLPTFTCARAIDNLQSICSEDIILTSFLCVGFNENVLLLKSIRVNYRPFQRAFKSSNITFEYYLQVLLFFLLICFQSWSTVTFLIFRDFLMIDWSFVSQEMYIRVIIMVYTSCLMSCKWLRT